MKLYSIIAMLPNTIGVYFGSFSSLTSATTALEEHMKKEEVPQDVIFNIFSNELDAPIPVDFILEKSVSLSQ